jgi:hypothetical protein
MPMFEAVFASGVLFEEDLENQAKSLISEIGPHVQDQESLKLICLLQLMTPPKTWMEQPIDFLAPAQIDLINLYEKYLTLIHRRFKWKLRPLSPVLTEDANVSHETMDGKRRRKRKCSSQDDGKDSPSNKKSNQLSERSDLSHPEAKVDADNVENDKSVDIFADSCPSSKEKLNDLTSSETHRIHIKRNKKSIDVNDYSYEDERLNMETWKYFDELTSVVKKIELLAEVMDKIQESIQENINNIQRDDYKNPSIRASI